MTRARDLGDFIADGGAPELVVDTTTLVVDSTNNRVGIGTASPSAALDVTGDVSIADKIIHTGDTNTAIRFPAADTVTVETGGSERMRVDSSGKVGIGTSSPSTPLHVVGNNGILVDTSGNGDGQIYFGGISGSDRSYLSRSTNDFAIWNVSSGVIKLATNDTERFRFGSAGQLGIGGATYGTSGQVLTSGGSGAAPTWADAAGGGGQFDAVASGTIANGALVSLNPDGTVTTTTQAVGNSTEFFSVVSYIGAAFDSSANKIVVAYRDGTNAKGMAAVGTVSGNSITFGTAVEFNDSNSNARAKYISVCYDPNANKTAIIFSDDGASGDKLKGSVGTISGTSISFGTTATLDNSVANYVDTVFDPDQNQIIVSYTDGSDGNHNAVNVVAISGTNISTSHVGSPFGANEAVRNRVVYDTNANKVVFFGIDDNFASNNGRGRVVVGTNSGTAMTFGSATTFNTTGDNGEEAQQQFGAAFDSTANKVVVAFRDGRDGNKGKAKTGTVSGTSITFGATATFSSTNTTEVNAVYDSTSNRTFITFRDDGDSDKGVVNAAAIIGTNLSLSGKIAYSPSTGNSKQNVPVVDSNSNKLVVFLEDASDSNAGDAVVCDTTGVDNFLKWIGFASAAISNSATGTINVLGGINESQSSLEVGATLYLSDAAALSTTAVSGREVGKALSATKLLITQGSVS